MHGNCIYLNLISFFCYVEFLNLYLYVKKNMDMILIYLPNNDWYFKIF